MIIASPVLPTSHTQSMLIEQYSILPYFCNQECNDNTKNSKIGFAGDINIFS